MKYGLLNFGAFGLVAFHFVVCGLPLVLSLFGSAFSLAGYISPAAMRALLVASGALLALSALVFFKGCGCDAKARKIQGIGLAISAALYSIALLAHFLAIGGGPSCH